MRLLAALVFIVQTALAGEVQPTNKPTEPANVSSEKASPAPDPAAQPAAENLTPEEEDASLDPDALPLKPDIIILRTKDGDPAATCQQIKDSLPRDYSRLRKMSRVYEEIAEDAPQFCVENTHCDLHHMKFSGLSLDFFKKPVDEKYTILSATISVNRWDITGNVFVGQKLEVLEDFYATKIPRGVSPIILKGDCALLTLWHRDGEVSRFNIDCQPCLGELP